MTAAHVLLFSVADSLDAATTRPIHAQNHLPSSKNLFLKLIMRRCEINEVRVLVADSLACNYVARVTQMTAANFLPFSVADSLDAATTRPIHAS